MDLLLLTELPIQDIYNNSKGGKNNKVDKTIVEVLQNVASGLFLTGMLDLATIHFKGIVSGMLRLCPHSGCGKFCASMEGSCRFHRHSPGLNPLYPVQQLQLQSSMAWSQLHAARMAARSAMAKQGKET